MTAHEKGKNPGEEKAPTENGQEYRTDKSSMGGPIQYRCLLNRPGEFFHQAPAEEAHQGEGDDLIAQDHPPAGILEMKRRVDGEEWNEQEKNRGKAEDQEKKDHPSLFREGLFGQLISHKNP